MLRGIEVAASRFSNVWFETTAFGKMAFFTLPCHKTDMCISRSHPYTCSDNLAALCPYHSLEAFIRRNHIPGTPRSDEFLFLWTTRRAHQSPGGHRSVQEGDCNHGGRAPDLDLKDNFFNASTNMSAEYLDLSSSLGSATPSKQSNSSVDGAAMQCVNTCKKHLSLVLQALRRGYPSTGHRRNGQCARWSRSTWTPSPASFG